MSPDGGDPLPSFLSYKRMRLAMKASSIAVLAVCLLALTACMASADSSAVTGESVDIGGVDVYCNDSDIVLDARSSHVIHLLLTNHGSEEVFVILKEGQMPEGITTDISNSLHKIKAKESVTVPITLTADRYAASTTAVVPIEITVVDSVESTGRLSIGVEVTSAYQGEGRFNMILGVFPNPFGDSLNTPVVNTVISAIIWIVVAMGLALGVDRLIEGRKRTSKGSQEAKDIKWVGRMVGVLVILYGISNCLRVYGADEYYIGTFADIGKILAYFVAAILAWKAYKVIVYNFVVKMDSKDVIDDSLLPLLNMIGKIVIAVVAVSVILAVMGLSLAAILTSAGLVTLGISLGAQSTLNQFFSGLVLMSSRPFRIGDKVRLGTDGDVLIVRKISVMETEFKNWLNEEVYRIPNSTVMASTIVNMTMDDKTYKVYEYFDISYSADVDKAREIIMSTVMSHPQVIKDGSKPMPQYRFQAMDSSSVKLRVTYTVPDHENYLTVSGQIKEAVFRRFRAEGIEIPFNVVDVHVRG